MILNFSPISPREINMIPKTTKIDNKINDGI